MVSDKNFSITLNYTEQVSYLGNGEAHGLYFDEGWFSYVHRERTTVLYCVYLHLTGERALVQKSSPVNLQNVYVLVGGVVKQFAPLVAAN